MDLFELYAKISVDDTEFKKSMENAQKVSKSVAVAMKELQSPLDKAKSGFNAMAHPIETAKKGFENLKNNIGSAKNIQIINKNGFEMLKSQTPPVTKRGAVLIDPSYEEAKDYEDVSKTVIAVNRKWSNGIIMVWYPLLSHRKFEIENMINSITEAVHQVNANTEILNLQLCVNSPDAHEETDLQTVLSDTDKKNPPRLYGSGMLVINAPWHLAEESDIVIKYLTSVFYFQKSL